MYCYLRKILLAMLVTSLICPMEESRRRQLFTFPHHTVGVQWPRRKPLGRGVYQHAVKALAHVVSAGLPFFFLTLSCCEGRCILGCHKCKLKLTCTFTYNSHRSSIAWVLYFHFFQGSPLSVLKKIHASLLY